MPVSKIFQRKECTHLHVDTGDFRVSSTLAQEVTLSSFANGPLGPGNLLTDALRGLARPCVQVCKTALVATLGNKVDSIELNVVLDIGHALHHSKLAILDVATELLVIVFYHNWPLKLPASLGIHEQRLTPLVIVVQIPLLYGPIDLMRDLVAREVRKRAVRVVGIESQFQKPLVA